MVEGLLIQADNLTALRRLPDESLDLIYLDPPFRSEHVYRTIQSADEASGVKVFDDRWRWNESYDTILMNMSSSKHANTCQLVGGFALLFGKTGRLAYNLFMIERLLEMKRLLKPTGSIALHCDQASSSSLKVIMDSLFGEQNYLNTIVWCYGLGGSSPRRYPRKHDDIHWFSKEENRQYFAAPVEPARSRRMMGKSKKIPDFWYIPSINNMAHERTGYPTQKPLALLERIVVSSCPPGGKVLDPFCGSGTTLVAAARNSRNWVGVDIAPEAIETTIRRLEAEGFDRNLSFQRWE